MPDLNPYGSTYLGDGLYAGFDGFQIILYTERESGTHWVALDPSVFSALLRFKEKVSA